MNRETPEMPPGIEAKQARSVLSTHRLLDAASELIAEVGYERASLATIAKRAGYSHGLVTQRFGSKENMLFALVDRMTSGAPADHAGPGLSAEDEILAAFDVVLEGWRRSQRSMQALYVLMFTSLTALPALRDRMTALHRDLRERIAEVARRGVERGELVAAADAEEIARAVVGSLRGCAYQWVLDPDQFDFELAISEERRAMAARLAAFRVTALSSETEGAER
jgi:AcrR family transcriptional regulator